MVASSGATPSQPSSRIIPGMPVTAQLQGGKKKKSKSSSGPGSTVNGHHDAITTAARAATLTDKSPAHGAVDESVKVQPSDLAEQAEQQSALAAVAIVEEKEGATMANGHAQGEEKLTGSALHQSIQKRIKVLNKKLQRAIAYSEKSESDLNADMKRIIASKGYFEGAVAELTETLKAVEISEKEHSRQQSTERKVVLAQAEQAGAQQTERTLKILFQLSHLNALISASMQASFAPPTLPDILQTATSQQVAAIGKLNASLSSPADVNSAEEKIALVNKLASGSKEEVLPGVAYKDILLIVEGLSTSRTEQTAVPEVEALAEKIEEPEEEKTPEAPAPTEPKQSSPKILFMQASELDQSTDSTVQETEGSFNTEALEHVKPAEPEGGAVDGVAPQAISGGASAKGQNGAGGVVLGAESVAEATAQDGSAKAAVDEPVQTTEVAATSAPSASPAPPAAAPAPASKVIDWSANDDDDDFGDLEMQPEASAITATQKDVESESVSKASEPASVQAAQTPSNARFGQLRPNAGQRHDSSGKPPRSKAPQQAPAPNAAPKLAPQVDEDGFIVASSKRTKMQQQQQQAQSQRGRGQGRGTYRGTVPNGRGGGAMGGGGRGNGLFQAGGASAGRGRGRGRGGAPPPVESA